MYSPGKASRAVGESHNRIPDTRPVCGLCVTCIEECLAGMCEVKLSGIRGPEAIYPSPFGKLTAGSQKDYPVSWGDFQILGTAVGAHGVKEDSDEATFPNVVVETVLGRNHRYPGIKINFPVIVPGLGSTDVARTNWDGLAMGAALYGIPITVGENVVGMDPEASILDRRVIESPALRHRVEEYRKWQKYNNGHGAVIIQENVEDNRLGVLEYAIRELGVEAVELKWGQGAKDIGGEVKIERIEKARMLKDRGYIVLPDPTDPEVVIAFDKKLFAEFERHSRIGMVREDAFAKRVEELRKAGAHYLFLKTGAYRFADLARALVYSSKYGIDVLTIDAAGGGTGMSPWRMMCEWGVPPIELFAKTYEIAEDIHRKGKHLPDIVFAGGFSLEDHVSKGLAFGEPYVKAIGMASAPLTTVMSGRFIAREARAGNLPKNVERFGKNLEQIFYSSLEVQKLIKDEFQSMAAGNDHKDETLGAALSLFSYLMRVSQGTKQFMTGARKFNVNNPGERLDRGDLVALTERAAKISGIQDVMDHDRKEVEKIISGLQE